MTNTQFNERLEKHLRVMVEFAPEDSDKIRKAARMYLEENGIEPDILVNAPKHLPVYECLMHSCVIPEMYFAWELLVGFLRLERLR